MEAGQVGVHAHVSAERAARRHEHGLWFKARPAVEHVLTICVRRKLVTEIIVRTEARQIAVDAVVERDTEGHVASKVSLNKQIRC